MGLEGIVRNSFEKCLDWAAGHRAVSSIGAGLLAGTVVYALPNIASAISDTLKPPFPLFYESLANIVTKETFIDYAKDASVQAGVYFAAAGAWLSNYALNVRYCLKELGAGKRQRSGLEERAKEKRTLKDSLTNYAKHPLDFLIEHPIVPALAAFGYFTAKSMDAYQGLYAVARYSKSFDDVKPLIQLSAIHAAYSAVAGISTYFFSKYFCFFLHSKSKGYSHFALGAVAASLRNNKLALKEFDKGLAQNPASDVMTSKGMALIRLGMFEEGLEQFRAAMASQSNSSAISAPMMNFGLYSSILENYKRIKKDSADIPPNIDLAVTLLHAGYADKSKEIMERLAAMHPEKLELRCFAAEFFEVAGDRKKSEGFLRETAEIVAKNKELMREPLGESKNKVYAIGPSSFIRRAFVFKEGALEDLVGEAQTISELKAIIGDNKQFVVPASLGIVDYDHTHSHVLKRIPGELLTERIRNKNKNLEQDLEGIFEFLGLIEGKYPIEKSTKGNAAIKRDINEKIAAVAPQYAGSIISGMAPVFRALENSIYVFDKDPHPDNWEIVEKTEYSPAEKIAALDCEAKKFRPMPIQLAKLLGNIGLGRDKTRQLVETHAGLYNNSAKSFNLQGDFSGKPLVTDTNFLQLCYLNAIIYTSFDLFAVLANKKSRQEDRARWIERGAEAVRDISEEFGDYYNSNKQNYDDLAEHINALKANACAAA